jgi:hypothetical protein
MNVAVLARENWSSVRRIFLWGMLPIGAGFGISYFLANSAYKHGWGIFFGILGILFLIGFSIRRSVIAVVAIVLTFVAHGSFINLDLERWILLSVGMVPLLWRLVVRTGQETVFTKFHIAFLIFIGWIYTTALYSENSLLTFAKSTSVLLVFICYFMVMFYYLKERPGDFKMPFTILLYLNAVVITFSILQDPAALMTFRLSGKSVLGNPNSLGAFIALSISYVIFQYYESKAKIGTVLWMVLLWLNVIFVLATLSRAGLLGTLAAISIYWFARNRAGFYYFGGILICGVMAVAVLSPARGEAMLNTYVRKGGGEVMRSRMPLWERQVEVFKRNPMTGVGFGVSEGMGKLWKPGFSSGLALAEPGGSVFMLLEGTGLPGAVLGFAPLSVLLWYGFKRYRELLTIPPDEWSKEQRFLPPLLAGVVGGTINCQFEGWLYAMGGLWPQLYWLQVALLLFVIVRLEEKELDMIPDGDF